MSVAETFKSNPIKILLGSAGSIIAVVGALFTIDARYAHAADVEQTKKETQQVIKETAIILRKQVIEDKLFEYDVKKEQAPDRRLSPIDSAMQQRYKRQLEDLKSGRIPE
jgi:hypothetical protein